MDQDTLGVVLAAVLAGLAVLLTVVAMAKQPFLLVVALPFAAGAYLVWKGATGQVLFGPSRTRRVDPEEARGERATRGARDPSADRERRERATAGDRRRRDPRGSRGPGDGARDVLARREAYRVLGLDPDADQAAVRRAYREQVKDVHPDAEDGDSDEFRRLTEAYERLRE